MQFARANAKIRNTIRLPIRIKNKTYLKPTTRPKLIHFN